MKKIGLLLDYAEEIVASSFLIFTSFLVFIQVIFRYQFNYSIYWSEEVSRYLIVWFIFIGSSMAVREKAHVTVDVLTNYLPPKGKNVCLVLANLISLAFCAIIMYSGNRMIANSIRFNSVSAALEMPLMYPYAAIPVGMGLMFIRYFQDFYVNVKQLFVKEKVEKEEREGELAC